MKQLTKYVLPLMLLVAPLLAQENTPMPPPPRDEEMTDRRHVDPEKRKAFREKLEAKIIQKKHEKIREILTLDDAQAKNFFDKYTPAEKEMVELVKARNESEIKLLKLTKGELTDGDVDPTLHNIKELNAKLLGLYEKLDGDMKLLLNPRQRAKLLVFEHEFNRKVREKVREMRDNFRKDHPDFRPKRPNGPDGPPPPRYRKR